MRRLLQGTDGGLLAYAGTVIGSLLAGILVVTPIGQTQTGDEGPLNKEIGMEPTVAQIYEAAREKINLLTQGSTSWPRTDQNASAVFESTGISTRAKREGDFAPDVTLPDAFGRLMRLSDSWRKGPLIVIFYRGGWCSYCNLQLRAWQTHASELSSLNATLLAISPQTPDNSMTTAEINALAYPVLSDSTLDAAEGFNISFTLPPELVDFYGAVGVDVPVFNGNGQWVLPVPSTFVIDEGGTIRFAHVDEDVRHRPEPRDVLALIRKMSASRLNE
jgi:peroxiredoxin